MLLAGNHLFSLLAFAGTTGLGLLVVWWYSADVRRLQARLRGLSEPEIDLTERRGVGNLVTALAHKAGSGFGRLLVPGDKTKQEQLKFRLTQAGLYSPHAGRLFMVLQLLALVVFFLLGVTIPWSLHLLGPSDCMLSGLAAGLAGIFAPALWVDARRRKRQSLLRRGLPDALDMLVLCLDGGVSLTAAIQRVTVELQTIHPLLAAELVIVQRETLLGLSMGEALTKFVQRSGLAEAQEVASVLLQSERFGASVGKALRAHADSYRIERQHHAEEMAQKAAVKILIPTLLCIFPAVFIVILGPAAYQVAAMLRGMR